VNTETTTPIRLVLADDHPIVLEGLAQLLSIEPGFEVIARASDGDQALDLVRSSRPDVLVLDIRMPGKDGLDVLREMRTEHLPTRVVVLTAVEDDAAVEAIRLGAHGVVSKDIAPKQLLACVRAVHAGGRWFEKDDAFCAIEKFVDADWGRHEIRNTLTPREVDVARMVASGLHTKAVADRLSISEGTAKLHLHHVYEKLKVDGRVGLIRYMLGRGLA